MQIVYERRAVQERRGWKGIRSAGRVHVTYRYHKRRGNMATKDGQRREIDGHSRAPEEDEEESRGCWLPPLLFRLPVSTATDDVTLDVGFVASSGSNTDESPADYNFKNLKKWKKKRKNSNDGPWFSDWESSISESYGSRLSAGNRVAAGTSVLKRKQENNKLHWN